MTPSVRSAVFIVGCLGSRLLLTLVARHFTVARPAGNATALPRLALAVAALAVAGGLLAHYWFGTRPVAFEAGGRVWWNSVRPVHAALFAGFAVLALASPGYRRYAWLFLLADWLFAVAVWVTHRLLLGGGSSGAA